ncbi:MAG: sensor histidine kinase [Limisphaerales bacterium]
MDSSAATASDAVSSAPGPEEKHLSAALAKRSATDVADWASSHWQVVIGALVLIPLAIVDFWRGYGGAVAPLYVTPVLLSLWSEKPKYSIIFGYLATALILAGFMQKGVSNANELEIVQRLCGLALVWLAASLSLQRWQHGRSLERGYHEMEQVVEVRTEALVKANANLQQEIGDREDVESNLRQLSNHLMTAQDQERRRIARELHDNSGQILSAISMNLTRIEHQVEEGPRKVQDLVEDTIVLVDQTSREIRTLSYLLHPPLLEESGLIAAINWFAKGFSQRSGIDARVKVSASFERLEQDIEMTLFRIVQEALTNISRHSLSPSARISLQQNPGEVVLRIEDEGQGIPPEKLERVHGNVAGLGVGIAGIWERVKHVKGELEIISNSNGTTILVVLPITEIES